VIVHVTPLNAKSLSKQWRKHAERCRKLKVLLCTLRFEWKTFSPVATSEQKISVMIVFAATFRLNKPRAKYAQILIEAEVFMHRRR